MIKLQISIPFINTFIGLIFQIYRYLLELVRTGLRPAGLAFLLLFIILNFFCSSLSAQTTGLIYKPATGAGKAVLDPNGDGYTSPTSAGFSGTDYLTGSELKMVAIPQLDTEPSGDLATGSSGGHTDIVDAGANRKSVFVMSDGTNLIIRFRIGNASTASKGYSILIDTDNSFAGSGANPGFEQEIVLETGTNGRIAVYNHTLGVGTLSSSYNIDDNHQRSIALTTNNGDADYFYDFFVPLSAVSGNPVRFAAATITSAGSGITGTISDVDGVNDLNYNSNVPAMLTAVVSSFPSSSLTTMTAGSTFAPAQSGAPYISSSVLTTSTSVSGTSAEPNGAAITVYKNGTSIGTSSVNSSAWILSGIPGGTFSAGNVITAKAQDNTAGKTLSNVSNSVIVGQICTSAPVITGEVSGGKGYSGNWTPLAGQSITANSVRIYIHGISAETVTIGGQNFVTGQAFTITTNDAGNPVYVAPNATVGFFSTWSFQLFNTGNSVPKGTYWATAENISTGSCVSNTSNLQYRTIPATTAPVITSSPVYDSDNQVSGTKITNAKIFFYVNGVERLTISANPNSTSWTAAGLNLVVGDKLTAKAIVDGASGLSLASNEITVQDLLNGATATPVITGTYNNTKTTVSGTSTEGAGTIITAYKNAVSIGTATVNIFGAWTLTGISLATNDILTAKAIANNKNESPLSNAVKVLGPTTNVPAVNSPVYANSTSIGGTLASGVLKVYIDGEPLSPSLISQSGAWTYSTTQLASLASELYAGAVIKATNTENEKLESGTSPAVTVVGVNNFLVEKAGGGNIATQTAGIAFPVKLTARDGSSNTFTTYTGKNVFSSGSTISEGSGPTASFASGILSSHNITLTKAGSYTLRTVGTDNPSVSGTSNVFLINPSSPHTLQIFQQASAAVTSEVTFAQQPVIYVYDQYGNHVSSDNTTQVSVSIASGTGGTLNGVKTLTAVNGVITFSGLNIQGSGPYTLQFAAAGLTSVSSGSITVTVSNPPAPASLSYTTPNNFTTGLAITDLSPTVTGTVASYSVNPALPAGLTLNTGTGLISGTPTVAVAQANYTLTATNSGGSTEFAISITVVGGAAPVASLVAVSGTTTVGQILTGSFTYTDADGDAQGTSTLRWLSNTTETGNYSPIAGATSGTYTLTASDQGKFIKFEVTPISATGTPSTGTAVQSSATAAIQGRAPTATLVAISSTTTVGQILTGSFTYTDADNDLQGTSTLRWLSNTTETGTYTPISGATSSTYTLMAADQGKFIKFEVTPISATGTPSTGTVVQSSATAAIQGRAPTATAVTISGTTTVGQILTGSFTYTDADGDAQGTSTYRWLSNTTETGTYTLISGATSGTYTLTASDQGKFLKFEVTPISATGMPSTGTAVQSSATSAILGRAPIATAVTIGGTTTVGQILTGNFTYTDADGDAQGTSTYRWLSSTTETGTYTPISGATSGTYTLTASDQGKFIKFEVTPISATGTPSTGTTVQSSATTAIQGRAPAATALTISGTTTVGQILTGSFTYTDADTDLQGTSTLRWLSSTTATGTYTPISGATSSTYTLTAGDQNKFIKFEVTPISATGTPSTGTTVQSSATTAIQGRAPAATALTISGTTTVGQILTGSFTYTDADTDLQGTSTYRWLSSTTETGNYSPISGATSNTYTLTASDQGKFIKFEVTPISATGTPSTGTAAQSSATAKVQAAISNLPVFTYSSPNVYTKGLAITPLIPLNTGGAVTSYSVGPALPAGLNLNPVTGEITGTPIAVTGQGSYTVTATNSKGSTNINLVLTIKDILPLFTYSSPNVFTKGSIITSLVPLNTGGAVTGYSVDPVLPAGLSLNPVSGQISGIPTSVTGEATYKVTANNSGGSSSFSLVLTVKDAPPVLTYGSQNALFFTRGAYIKAVVPINTGGMVSGYSVGPALPEGLSLNPSTGVISGIPTSVSPEAIYTITANATGESKDFKISIRIDEAQPKIEVLLTATNPIKQSDGTFNVDYRVKISNKGNTVLSNLELTVDLSKVFPAPVQFKLLGVPRVSGSSIISDGSFNGISNSNLIASSSFKINSLNEPVYFSGDLKTEELLFVLNSRKRSTYIKEALSNNSMFGSSELALNDTAVVIFSLNIKPNGNFGPYAMNVLGTAQDQAGKVVSEMSTDGHLVGNTGVTSIKYPTIVSVIPNPLIGAALSVQEIERINDNSYSVKLRARIKNSGNLNLSQVKIMADLANQFKRTSSFTVQSLSINTNNGLLVDSKFDGKSHTNLLLTESAIGVGKENLLDLMLNIQPNGVYGNYSVQLALEAFGMDSNDKVSNFSMVGLDPDRSVIDMKNNKPTVFNLPFPGPQDLALHNNTINENNALNAIAGNFTARDINPSAVLTYTLVSGAGDSDNSKFKVSGSDLLAAEIFNYEQKAFYNIRVKVSNQLGQASENSFSIAVRDINEAPTLSKILDQRIFLSADQQAIALSGISAGPETSQQTTLNLSADNPALFDQLDIVGNEIRYKLKDGALGASTIRVEVIDDGGVLNGGINQVSRSFELRIDPLPIITASPAIISKGFISNLLVSTQVQVTYLWSPSAELSNSKISNPIARPAKTTTYYVKVNNQFGSSITLSTTIVVLEDYNILIPNVFSPNDDGINDSWVIENIDSYPDHVLTLFDRSGRVLNQVKNYQNDWKGTANGQPLEEGTYYYTIQFLNAKNSMKKGFVSIIK